MAEPTDQDRVREWLRGLSHCATEAEREHFTAEQFAAARREGEQAGLERAERAHQGVTVIGRASDGLECDWRECPVCHVEHPCGAYLHLRRLRETGE